MQILRVQRVDVFSSVLALNKRSKYQQVKAVLFYNACKRVDQYQMF